MRSARPIHRRLRAAATWLLALCVLVMSSAAWAAPAGPWSEPDAACPVTCPCDFEGDFEGDCEHGTETSSPSVVAARASFEAAPAPDDCDDCNDRDDCDDCIEGCSACDCRVPTVVALLPSSSSSELEVARAKTLLGAVKAPVVGTEAGVFRPPRTHR